MSTTLTLDTARCNDGKLVLTATGEIDLSNIDAFNCALAAATTEAAGNGETLTVDLSGLEYLDSAAVNALCARAEHIHVRNGRPFEEICRLATKTDVDLIVIPTRGNTGLKHLMLGSTAERVVRYSPCPVLVFRSGPKGRRNGKLPAASITFRRIVVPTDFSDSSMKALNYAKQLAKKFKAKLILSHSIAMQYFLTSDEYAPYDLPVLMEQAEKRARGQMRDLVAQTQRGGTKVESSMQIGHAGQEICASAEAERADLIVTATHGLTGLKRLLMGSTAEYVVRHATCPVLVIPTRSSQPI